MPYFRIFDGRMIDIDTIEHQHLSNCYWYNKIILNCNTDNDAILAMLQQRFNGNLLNYRPKYNFKFEIDTLYKKNIVFSTSDPDRDVIVIDGFEIGEIIKK